MMSKKLSSKVSIQDGAKRSPPKSRRLLTPSMFMSRLTSSSSSTGSRKWYHDRHPSPVENRQDVDVTATATLKCRMSERVGDYMKTERLSVFCGTWNVNGRAACEVEKFLLIDDPKPDVFAIGFQELDLRPEVLVLNETPRERDWVMAIETALGPSYAQVRTVRLVGMLLVVYVRQDLRGQVHDVSTDIVGTGLLRKMGNKGGVAIRAKFSMSSVCFVCTHLAAHQDEVERRNEDFHDIMSRITFNDGTGISDADMVVWCGDMNYRLNLHQISEMEARTLALTDFSQLLNMDQLTQERGFRRAFHGFQEAPITFQPSYKYDPGTDIFDTSDKARVPAWCDRVLCRGKDIEITKYRVHMSMMISDHKPVSALVHLPMTVVDSKLKQEVFADELFTLDRMTNNMMPSVQLSQNDLIFDALKFLEPQELTVNVQNTGTVPCQYSFVNRTKAPTTLPTWLAIKPSVARLQPGKSVDIAFTVQVKASELSSFNEEPKRDCILVMHLEGSRDYFMNVTVVFQPTVFGCSLIKLACSPTERVSGCSAPVPIPKSNRGSIGFSSSSNSTHTFYMRSLSAQPTETSVGIAPSRSLNDQMPSVEEDLDNPPRPLWVLFDELVEHAMNTPYLFVDGGRNSELIEIRNRLDNSNFDLKGISMRSIGEALLLFLEALPEPIIPFRFHAECLANSHDELACHAMLEMLPLVHLTSFMKLTMMLSLLLRNTEKGLQHVHRATILSLFANLAFQPRYEHESTKARAAKEKKHVHFLTHFVR